MIGNMKRLMRSSAESKAPVAKLRQDRLSKVGVESKLSRCNAARSKNYLSWYVALNSEKPSKEKVSGIPQIKWKCPSKFALNASWLVAAGEGSEEAATQKHKETTMREIVYRDLTSIPPCPSVSPHLGSECYDNSPTPIIPLIPIEEVDTTTPSHTSDSDKGRSVPGNLPDPSGPQDQMVSDNSLFNMLRGLERTDLEVAVAAAATVAAVMEKKKQIDTQLLIKFLTDPEMVKKLLDENGPNSKPGKTAAPSPTENTTPPAPNPTKNATPPAPNPTKNATPPAPNPTKNANPPAPKPTKNATPPATNPTKNATPPATNPTKKVTPPAKNATPPAPNPTGNPPNPTGNPTPPVPSPNTSLSLPAPKHVSEYSELVKKSSPLLRSGPRLPPVRNLTREPIIEQVRPLMPYTWRPDPEMDRLVNKYLAPNIALVTPRGPLNTCTSSPNMELAMVHEYGAPGAALTGKTMNGYGVEPFVGRPTTLPPPLPPVTNHALGTPLPPVRNHASGSDYTTPGNFHFPNFYSAPTHTPNVGFDQYLPITPAPNVGFNHYTTLMKQHGEMHGMGEQKFPIIGQPGNNLQGFKLGHNMSSIVTNPTFSKPCLYFSSPKGCQNGYNCQYRHDVCKQTNIGAMEIPEAKRMKFT